MTFEEWWEFDLGRGKTRSRNMSDGYHPDEIARIAYRAGQEEMRGRAADYLIDRDLDYFATDILSLPLEGDDE